ncbi:adenosine deaminase [Subtercola lobariae]|uniref:Adenosine/adenine deaminase n=1 Tax=Subtercola lobariae TaxID=1588641 RepID=A0A917EYY4_9MICO|nr:adenosine deaminase [Subtercola lobariae]GGF35481.1 putative adenosine/adenine deaminase [Subtercola lobariae]
MTDSATETTSTTIAAADSTRDLAKLPKGHLHLHMEAAIRAETLTAMCVAAGIEIELPDLTQTYSDFSAFSATYRSMLAVLVEPENLFRLIDESVEDAAREGVVYVEFGASPHFYIDTFGPVERALQIMIDTCAEAGAKWGVEIGLMITIDRTESVEVANAYAAVAAAFAGRGVVSLGLANDERGHPAEDFEEAFTIGRAAGLLSTPHAGELAGPEQVWKAVEVLGANRILHGVTSVEDPALMARLAADGVCLDVCPTSNLLLSVVGEIDAHPLRVLLDAGVRCSINADDPVLFGPNILSEYELCRSVLGLTDAQLAACAWSSIECGGGSAELKARSKLAIEEWLAS